MTLDHSDDIRIGDFRSVAIGRPRGAGDLARPIPADGGADPLPARRETAAAEPSLDDFIRLTESHGALGSWSWRFDVNRHVWSPGCFHLLGLDPRTTRPSYGLLLERLHPADRDLLPGPGDLVRGEPGTGLTVRVLRSDGAMRILAARSEVKFEPGGRPACALGTLFDVTEHEQGLRARAAMRRQTAALCRRARILWFTLHRDGTFDFEPEAAALLGCPPGSLARDPFAAAEPEARAALRAVLAGPGAAPHEIRRDVVLRLPDGGTRACRIVMIPAEEDSSSPWTGLVQLDEGPERAASGAGDERLRGLHLRAARALLDWSMHDLAVASGLSLSTVRRLETDDAAARPARSRPRVAAALRGAGVRFLALDDGTVAVCPTP